MKLVHTAALITITSVLAGCGNGGEPTVPSAQPAAASDADIGDHVVHFSAQSTDQLPPEVARAYGIVRSKNRAMLNVSVIDKETGAGTVADVVVR